MRFAASLASKRKVTFGVLTMARQRRNFRIANVYRARVRFLTMRSANLPSFRIYSLRHTRRASCEVRTRPRGAR